MAFDILVASRVVNQFRRLGAICLKSLVLSYGPSSYVLLSLLQLSKEIVLVYSNEIGTQRVHIRNIRKVLSKKKEFANSSGNSNTIENRRKRVSPQLFLHQ